MSTDTPPPVVCTLTTKGLAERSLEWSDLADHVLTRTAVDGGVTSTYPLAMAGQIEDLANRELSCCGTWLVIDHRRGDEQFHLTLTTTNPEGLGLIRAMSGILASDA